MSDELQYALTGDASGAKAAFDDVGASIARASKRTDDAAKSVQSMAAKLDRAASSATKQAIETNKGELAMASFGQGVSRAAQQLPGVGGAMSALSGGPMVAVVAAVTAAGAAFASLANQGINFADSLNDLSDRLGVPVETLSRLAPVAELGGTSLESLSTILGKFAAKVAVGDKSIQSLNLSTTDAVGAMIEISNRVKSATTQTEAIAIAQAAYGQQWQELMPILKMGGEYINETMGGAAVVTADMAAQSAQIKDTLSLMQGEILGTSVAIADIVAGPLQAMLDGFSLGLKLVRWTAEEWNQILTRDGGPNVTFAEDFLKKHVTKSVVYDNPDLPKQGRVTTGITESSLEQLTAEFKTLTVQERQRILDGIYRLNRETASTTMRSLFDENDQIIGLPISALADMTKQTGKDAKATSSYETPEQAAARETAAQKELAFLADLSRQIEEMTATEDARELVKLHNKYDKQLEAREGYSKSVLRIEEARAAELQNYYLKQNFAGLAAERDADEYTWNLPQNAELRKFGGYDRMNRARQIERSGMGAMNGTSWTYANQSSDGISMETIDLATAPAEKIQAAYDAAQKTQAIFFDKSRDEAIEFEEQWLSISDSIAGALGSTLGPALASLFTDPKRALEEFGEVGMKVLNDILSQILSTGIKWTALTFLTSGAGAGKGPGSFLGFLTKSFGGHAEGTLSSPGGIKYLGEQGAERVLTPMGDRYLASYGLYQVPSGTRVEPAGAPPSTGTKQFHLHTTQSDPIQVAEQFRRIVREEIVLAQSDEYRSRTY